MARVTKTLYNRGMAKQKIALVCDWLTGVGGAEKVILAVHRMYPEAPIYTSQYRPRAIDWFDEAEVRTGWLNCLPAWTKKFIPFLRQFYFSRLDLSDFDLVISITGAEAKAVRTGERTIHISYMHAPTQYYWTLYDQYIENPGFGLLNPIARWGLRLLVGPLRKADYKSAQNPNVVIANSSYVQKEIKKHYHRDSQVVWPNVDVEKIQRVVHDKGLVSKKRHGYIIYGRQVSWKRMDIAVQACVRLGRELLVVGYGPENKRLRQLALGADNIKFLPKYNGIEEIVERITSTQAFLFPAVEPFGIAPVEALASGTPVIGLRQGGAIDIIEDGVNGVFFEEQTAESLVEAIERFEKMSLDEKVVRQSAKKFAEAEFVERFRDVIERARQNEKTS